MSEVTHATAIIIDAVNEAFVVAPRVDIIYSFTKDWSMADRCMTEPSYRHATVNKLRSLVYSFPEAVLGQLLFTAENEPERIHLLHAGMSFCELLASGVIMLGSGELTSDGLLSPPSNQ